MIRAIILQKLPIAYVLLAIALILCLLCYIISMLLYIQLYKNTNICIIYNYESPVTSGIGIRLDLHIL